MLKLSRLGLSYLTSIASKLMMDRYYAPNTKVSRRSVVVHHIITCCTGTLNWTTTDRLLLPSVTLCEDHIYTTIPTHCWPSFPRLSSLLPPHPLAPRHTRLACPPLHPSVRSLLENPRVCLRLEGEHEKCRGKKIKYRRRAPLSREAHQTAPRTALQIRLASLCLSSGRKEGLGKGPL